MARSKLSRPLQNAVADNILSPETSFFDYGCGRGDDLRAVSTLGIDANGWDPKFRPAAPKQSADVVNLGYVINVIEDPQERVTTVRAAWSLTAKTLVISGRLAWESRNLAGRRHSDGIITSTGTFQKFFDQAELASWIENAVGKKPIAAAPGIFYVFRDERDEQDFVATRLYVYRPRLSIDPHKLYEATKDILNPLLQFMTRHGRPPRVGELPVVHEQEIRTEFQTLGRAVGLLRSVIDEAFWHEVTTQCRNELTVYAALSRFGRRPKFRDLSKTLQADIRAHFDTYEDVITLGDRLLVASGNPTMIAVSARASSLGKQTPSGLYVHTSALPKLSPLLQVYEGCARVLCGRVAGANIVKLSVVKPQVSFLSYPDFDNVAHPTLSAAITVDLRRQTVERRDYSASINPPLLHRKEEFVALDDPRRPIYERLTKSEIRAGLYQHPEHIGNADGWSQTLQRSGKRIVGHRLLRDSSRVD